jgi:hypothetical protein
MGCNGYKGLEKNLCRKQNTRADIKESLYYLQGGRFLTMWKLQKNYTVLPIIQNL